MIDLHSHILPNIDDGAKSLEISLEMARMAVADGTTHLACTPHFMPGVYDTTMAQMSKAVQDLEQVLACAGIELTLVPGGDVHIAPDLLEKLTNGTAPRLGNSVYFLFEPPHHVVPPNVTRACQTLLDKGYIPVLTHPERLTWIETHYDIMCALDEIGLAVQITAGSLTGSFGKRAQYWAERMLEEGRVDLIASDAHNTGSRPPGLSRARALIAQRLDEVTAERMVLGNPQKILNNQALAPKVRQKASSRRPGTGFWQRLGIGGKYNK